MFLYTVYKGWMQYTQHSGGLQLFAAAGSLDEFLVCYWRPYPSASCRQAYFELVSCVRVGDSIGAKIVGNFVKFESLNRANGTCSSVDRIRKVAGKRGDSRWEVKGEYLSPVILKPPLLSYGRQPY